MGLLWLKYSFSRRSSESEFTSQYRAEAANLTCMLSVAGVEDNWRPSSEMMTKKLTLSDVMMKDPSFLILTAMVIRTVTSPRPWSMTPWCWALGFTRHQTQINTATQCQLQTHNIIWLFVIVVYSLTCNYIVEVQAWFIRQYLNWLSSPQTSRNSNQRLAILVGRTHAQT